MSKTQTAPRPSPGRIVLYVLVAVLAFFALKGFQNRGQRFVGTTPQEFPDGGSWIGADTPLRLSQLRGKVILMTFGFINCPYCREMDPYLHKWHSELGPAGLMIVEIDDGSVDSLDDVRNWVRRAGVSYAVYHDTGGRMCANYGIDSFPTLLLVGRDGKVVLEEYGWPGKEGMAKIEKQIRAALDRPANQ